MPKFKKHYRALTVLNALAIPITGYLTYMHFKPEASDFCNVGEAFNCDIVNKSIYAEIFGIPVAILGLITYLLLLAFSIRGLKKDQSKLIPWVFAFVSGGLLFALYLTGIEAFVLKTWCLFCVAQQIIILIQWGVFVDLFRKTRKS